MLDSPVWSVSSSVWSAVILGKKKERKSLDQLFLYFSGVAASPDDFELFRLYERYVAATQELTFPVPQGMGTML